MRVDKAQCGAQKREMPEEIQRLLGITETALERGDIEGAKKVLSKLAAELRKSRSTPRELSKIQEITRIAQAMQLVGASMKNAPHKLKTWLALASEKTRFHP